MHADLRLTTIVMATTGVRIAAPGHVRPITRRIPVTIATTFSVFEAAAEQHRLATLDIRLQQLALHQLRARIEIVNSARMKRELPLP
jgi:hypothetical protein